GSGRQSERLIVNAKKGQLHEDVLGAAAAGLEPANVESAIDVKSLAGTERKRIGNDRPNRRCYIFRPAPTADRRPAVSDQPIVFLFYGDGHVAFDDSRTDFEDANALIGQPHGKKL